MAQLNSASDGRNQKRNPHCYPRERNRSAYISPPIWDRDEYSHIPEGNYLVQVVKLQGPEWVKRFSRWSLRAECQLTDEPVTLSIFFHMGGDKSAVAVPGRQSKFYLSWVMANGSPPRKGEAMDWRIFLGKFFRGKVEDCYRNSRNHKERKNDADVYSVITEFLSFEGP